MARKTKNFCDNIVFENYFANKNSKVWGNQNLQFIYDFDLDDYLVCIYVHII